MCSSEAVLATAESNLGEQTAVSQREQHSQIQEPLPKRKPVSVAVVFMVFMIDTHTTRKNTAVLGV